MLWFPIHSRRWNWCARTEFRRASESSASASCSACGIRLRCARNFFCFFFFLFDRKMCAARIRAFCCWSGFYFFKSSIFSLLSKIFFVIFFWLFFALVSKLLLFSFCYFFFYTRTHHFLCRCPSRWARPATACTSTCRTGRSRTCSRICRGAPSKTGPCSPTVCILCIKKIQKNSNIIFKTQKMYWQ